MPYFTADLADKLASSSSSPSSSISSKLRRVKGRLWYWIYKLTWYSIHKLTLCWIHKLTRSWMYKLVVAKSRSGVVLWKTKRLHGWRLRLFTVIFLVIITSCQVYKMNKTSLRPRVVICMRFMHMRKLLMGLVNRSNHSFICCLNFYLNKN